MEIKNKFARDENGLIKNIEYIFSADGRIDWKQMVPKEFLYINNDSSKKEYLEKKYGKNIKELDPIKDNIEDKDLVITLGGLKHLLFLRGYTSIDCQVVSASETYAAVSCSIRFVPNFESDGIHQTCSDCASAHFNSTSSFAKAYLLEIATNRAIARCIRSYLRLSIVSREELGGEEQKNDTPVSNGSPQSILENKCNEKNYSFAAVKKRAAEAYKDELESDPLTWNKWSDISPKDCYILLGKIKK